jgi:threonine dehydrogenase-like Zn-dependent dehydrogenase
MVCRNQDSMPHILGMMSPAWSAKLAVVRWVNAGDEVMIQPGVSCGHCAQCLAGRDNMCDEYDIIGYRRDGGYAELVAVPGVNVIPKPKNLSWAEAAALPLAPFPGVARGR